MTLVLLVLSVISLTGAYDTNPDDILSRLDGIQLTRSGTDGMQFFFQSALRFVNDSLLHIPTFFEVKIVLSIGQISVYFFWFQLKQSHVIVWQNGSGKTVRPLLPLRVLRPVHQKQLWRVCRRLRQPVLYAVDCYSCCSLIWVWFAC